MKFEPIEHRSDKWYAARLGKPTASEFGRIITPGGKPSSSAPLYMSRLIGERIFKRPLEQDKSGIPAVAHGIETEAEAAAKLEERIGPLLPGGFWTDDATGWNGEPGRYGCSPDRFLMKGNRREVAEIKCPEIPRHICNLLFGPGDDYRAQIQGQLFITHADVAHFWSYHPSCPPAYCRVTRDEPYIRMLDTLLDKFCEDLEENYQRALKMGAWAT